MVISAKAIIETPWGVLVVKDKINKKYTLPGGNLMKELKAKIDLIKHL